MNRIEKTGLYLLIVVTPFYFKMDGILQLVPLLFIIVAWALFCFGDEIETELSSRSQSHDRTHNDRQS